MIAIIRAEPARDGRASQPGESQRQRRRLGKLQLITIITYTLINNNYYYYIYIYIYIYIHTYFIMYNSFAAGCLEGKQIDIRFQSFFQFWSDWFVSVRGILEY